MANIVVTLTDKGLWQVVMDVHDWTSLVIAAGPNHGPIFVPVSNDQFAFEQPENWKGEPLQFTGGASDGGPSCTNTDPSNPAFQYQWRGREGLYYTAQFWCTMNNGYYFTGVLETRGNPIPGIDIGIPPFHFNEPKMTGLLKAPVAM